MPKRSAPEVNAGSMADIAFLLLIFFLVTSEMSEDKGVIQLLPEKNTEDTPPEDVNRRNVIEVLIRGNDEYLVAGKPVPVNQIPSVVSEMILNAGNRKDWPESRPITLEEIEKRIAINKTKLSEANETNERSLRNALVTSELRLKAYELFGDEFRLSKHVINLQSTQSAEYKTYTLIKDKLKSAYKLLKNDLAKRKLDRGWDDLTLEEKEMLDMVFDENISEAPINKN